MKTYIVDSFTDRAFTGNPAGVCVMHTTVCEKTMLNIARELGFSETAFVPEPRSAQPLPIRFFTPKMEVPICGHATLATAKVLFSDWELKTASFVNINGEQFHTKRKDDRIEMDFPTFDTAPSRVSDALLRALGIVDVLNCEHNPETNILVLEIENATTLAALTPDFPALLASTDSLYGVLVTAPGDNNAHDYHSRFFWPWSGTDEDPVTGGTQTFLGKYWAKRLGKTTMQAFQSSQRSGSMQVEVAGERTVISSHAVIVLRGVIDI